jgi:hypothetical protein
VTLLEPVNVDDLRQKVAALLAAASSRANAAEALNLRPLIEELTICSSILPSLR